MTQLPRARVELPYRVRAAKRNAPPEKLFGKYTELCLLVIGFVLTGVLGTFLSQAYTKQEANISAANRLFSDHSKLLGDRFFAMHQVMSAERPAGGRVISDTERAERWAKYASVVQQWNSARGYDREMIAYYFGPSAWASERKIHYRLRAWGISLERERAARGSVDFKCLDEQVDSILEDMHRHRALLAKAIQRNALHLDEDRLYEPELTTTSASRSGPSESGREPPPCIAKAAT